MELAEKALQALVSSHVSILIDRDNYSLPELKKLLQHKRKSIDFSTVSLIQTSSKLRRMKRYCLTLSLKRPIGLTTFTYAATSEIQLQWNWSKLRTSPAPK